MISIYGFQIQLPKFLDFINTQWEYLIATLVILILLAWVLYYVVFIYMKMFRTENLLLMWNLGRIDFILLVILYGLTKHQFFYYRNNNVVWIMLVLVIIHWASKLAQKRMFFQIAQNWDIPLDDILLPVLQRITSISIYIFGALGVLYWMGINLTGVYIALGGTAVLFGFVLQGVLSNLFSGLVVLIDRPFQFGDVIMLEDNTIAVIKNIGLRVTNLYDIKSHSDIFLPNSILANMKIVNITRPSTDLAMVIKISIGYASDYNRFKQILHDLILGHPDVLGEINEKLKALNNFSQLSNQKIEMAKIRLIAEMELNEKVLKLQQELRDFIRHIRNFQIGQEYGDKYAIKKMTTFFLEIMERIGFKPMMKKRWIVVQKIGLLETENEGNLIKLTRRWYDAWLKDPDLVEEDLVILSNECFQKIEELEAHIGRIYEALSVIKKNKSTMLLDYLQDFLLWISESYKAPRTLWKDPAVFLTEFASSALDFEISFYIDNLRLEHWSRAERVKDDLRMEIVRRFNENQIEIPFTQIDIWFRNPISHLEKRTFLDDGDKPKTIYTPR